MTPPGCLLMSPLGPTSVSTPLSCCFVDQIGCSEPGYSGCVSQRGRSTRSRREPAVFSASVTTTGRGRGRGTTDVGTGVSTVVLGDRVVRSGTRCRDTRLGLLVGGWRFPGSQEVSPVVEDSSVSRYFLVCSVLHPSPTWVSSLTERLPVLLFDSRSG